MPTRLRVGILGLGRRWPRWCRALGSLREILEPTALYDPRPRRAEQAARLLGCPLMDGVTALLERDDVDAVLLLDAPWYGLWPLEQACRVGKPVFCAAALSRDDANADALLACVQTAQLPVLMALPGPVAPAQIRLIRLLAQELGPARLVRAERGLVLPGRHGAITPAGLLASLPLLDLLVSLEALIGLPPTTVWAGGHTGGLVTLVLSYPQGRCAQVTLWVDGAQRVPPRLHVVAARGTATVESGSRLSWQDADKTHLYSHKCPHSAAALLDRFVKGLREESPLWPGIAEAYRALRVARAAAQSLSEGRPVATFIDLQLV